MQWELFARHLSPAISLGIAVLPTAFAFASLWRLKRKYDSGAKEPFTDLPLRPLGESARIAADDLFDEAGILMLTVMLTSYFAGIFLLFFPQFLRPSAGLAGALAIVAISLAVVWRGTRLVVKSWDYRLGSKGERVVAQVLHELLSINYRVFHDIPFDGYNIDHIVVGQNGVFVIETKTRRKRKAVRGQPQHVVVLDGSALVWPSGARDSESVAQAERNGRSVAEWLGKATGKPVKCLPVLTVPGWWVEWKKPKACNVVVASTKGLDRLIASWNGPALEKSEIEAIAYQIAARAAESKK